MRLLSYWIKTFKENLREWKILVLALVFGPFFVFMMYFYFGTASPSYTLLVINRDGPAALSENTERTAGADLISAWKELRYPEGKPIFKIRIISSPEEGRRLLKNRDADLMFIIPAGYSQELAAFKAGKREAPERLTSVGDESSVRFMVAAALADYSLYACIAAATGTQMPQAVDFEALRTGRPLNDFDLYVPALLVLAVIMVLFTAAASIIKEVDKGTIIRLALSKLTTFEFLSAISLNQLVIGIVAVGLTYLSAKSVGYHGGGSAPVFLIVGAVSILSVIAISLIVAGWMRTIFELLTVGVFPFFILMFFSESMFPLPRIVLFRLAGQAFYINDVLPTSLTVKAFNKILNFGAGFDGVLFELGWMAGLTTIYFAVGLWLFRRRHLSRRAKS